MKIKRSKLHKALIKIETARILLDDALPLGNYIHVPKVEQAYDLLLGAEELLTKKEGKLNGKRRFARSIRETRADR